MDLNRIIKPSPLHALGPPIPLEVDHKPCFCMTQLIQIIPVSSMCQGCHHLDKCIIDYAYAHMDKQRVLSTICNFLLQANYNLVTLVLVYGPVGVVERWKIVTMFFFVNLPSRVLETV